MIKCSVLQENLGSVPSAHVVAHYHLKLQVQGSQYFLLATSDSSYTHDLQTHMQEKHLFTGNIF